jgi:hypothetical protein
MKYKQSITDPKIGDCYRACMATMLDLPPEVLPNDFSPFWHSNWNNYLKQFGLGLSYSHPASGPIWLPGMWLASVKSLNFDEALHAIVMHKTDIVYHDPSRRKRYRAGTRLSSNEVVSGEHLVVNDASLLGELVRYRNWLKEE